MYAYFFEDPEVAERIADGLLKAGMKGKTSGYYKISDENRLSGEKISELLFGRTITNINIGTGVQNWITNSKDGKEIKFRDSTGFSDSGKAWLEGDLHCQKWKMLLSHVPTCFHIYRNLDGTPEKNNEYLFVGKDRIDPWSPID